jgi:hypothetical protein
MARASISFISVDTPRRSASKLRCSLGERHHPVHHRHVRLLERAADDARVAATGVTPRLGAKPRAGSRSTSSSDPNWTTLIRPAITSPASRSRHR